MIHKAFNKTEIAERYYKKLGKFVSREQSKKNFALLRHPKKEVIIEVIREIEKEQKQLLK